MDSRNSPIPRARQRVVIYSRHFILLGAVAAALGLTDRWRQGLGALATIGVYGALHASTLVAALRLRKALWRRLAFICLAAGLAMLSLRVGLAVGSGAPAAWLTACAALGAASYGLLIRRFWIRDLRFGALFAITLCCGLSTLVAMPLGRLLHTAGPGWFAMVWWWSFSLALRYTDTDGDVL
jgi:hypothetical protein